MIIHHENIQNITLGIKNKLKYSKEYTFIPLQIFHENQFTDCIFQTPKLFIPYGIKTLDTIKDFRFIFSKHRNDNKLENLNYFLKKL